LLSSITAAKNPLTAAAAAAAATTWQFFFSSSSSSSTITNAIPNLHHKINHLFQNLLNPLFVNSPPINHSFHACVHNIGMKELKENSYKKCQER
jgi:hypothetical protein